MLVRIITFFLLYSDIALCATCSFNTPYEGLSCNLNLAYNNLMNIKKLLHNNEDRFIALTFDDGPSSLARVNSILNVLEEHNAKATFFLLGERINSSSRNKAVKKIYNAGHEIGNHSWSHRKLTTLSSEEQFQELEGTNIAIERIIGKGVKWFRPPGGSHDESVINHAKQLNMCSILWTIDSLDWRGENPEVLVERVISSVHNGAIILLHDHHRQNTVEALPRIITILTKLGYSLVTLSEWEEKVCDALGKKQSF